MYLHHSPSRVTAQVVGDGFWCCLLSTFVARVPRATALRAGTDGPFARRCEHAHAGAMDCSEARTVLGLDTCGGRDWALLGLVAHGTGFCAHECDLVRVSSVPPTPQWDWQSICGARERVGRVRYV